MDWTQLLALILGNAAIIIPLWLHLENKMDDVSERQRQEMKEQQYAMKEFREMWAQETKDFHGRLERQDAEFRTRFLALEERRIKVLEK